MKYKKTNDDTESVNLGDYKNGAVIEFKGDENGYGWLGENIEYSDG